MSGKEGDFLSRWSRMKREATRRDEPAASPPAAAAEPVPPLVAEQADASGTGRENDLPPLPSLSEITPATDLSVFMHPAVPEPIRQAALRRMWSIDPAVRDFVSEGVDYAWDFNAPGAVSGFGRLGPADDVARMVADLLTPPAGQDDAPPAEAPVPAADAQAPMASDFRLSHDEDVAIPNREIREECADLQVVDGSQAVVEPAEPSVDRPVHEFTSGDSGAERTQNNAPRRRHGGAMPA